MEIRPDVLECDVVRFQNNKEKWVAFVGLLDGKPYEIFTGLQDDEEGIVLPKTVNKGKEDNEVTAKRAFMIGLFQCISVIPGVSRSMATIVGGMTQKLTRKKAAEFSFFLAVPTMAGATLLDLLDMLDSETSWATSEHIFLLLLGCAIAFVVALFAMKWFVSFLTKYGFKAFGWYRIVVGTVIVCLLLAGFDLNMVD